MKLDIVWTTQFKKDYKLAIKRHFNIELLDDIIRSLSRGETLPEKNRDHAGGSRLSVGRLFYACQLFPGKRRVGWEIIYR